MNTTVPSPKITIMRKMPILVRIIALLYYIGAALGGIGILAFFFGFIVGINMPALVPLFTFGLLALVPLTISIVLGYFMGRGLYRGENWSRIVFIFFSLIGILNTLLDLKKERLILSVLLIVINALLASYFLFNKRVKVAFGVQYA